MTQLQSNHPYRLIVDQDKRIERVRWLCGMSAVPPKLTQTLQELAMLGDLLEQQIVTQITVKALAARMQVKPRTMKARVQRIIDFDLEWLEVEGHNWGTRFVLHLSDRHTAVHTAVHMAVHTDGHTAVHMDGHTAVHTDPAPRVRAVAGDIYPDSSPMEKKVAAVVAEDTAPAASRFAPDSLEMFIGETCHGLGYEPFVDEALERIAARVRVGISDEGEQRAFIEDTALKIHTKGLRRATLLNALMNDIDGWLAGRAYRQEVNARLEQGQESTGWTPPVRRQRRLPNGAYDERNQRELVENLARRNTKAPEYTDAQIAERKRERLRKQCLSEYQEAAREINNHLINPELPFNPALMLEHRLCSEELVETMQEMADELAAAQGGPR